MISKPSKFQYIVLVVVLIVAADAWRRSWQSARMPISQEMRPLRREMRELRREMEEMARLWLEQQSTLTKLQAAVSLRRGMIPVESRPAWDADVKRAAREGVAAATFPSEAETREKQLVDETLITELVGVITDVAAGASQPDTRKTTVARKLPTEPDTRKTTVARKLPTEPEKRKTVVARKLPTEPEVRKTTVARKYPTEPEARKTTVAKKPPTEPERRKTTVARKLPTEPDTRKTVVARKQQVKVVAAEKVSAQQEPARKAADGPLAAPGSTTVFPDIITFVSTGATTTVDAKVDKVKRSAISPSTGVTATVDAKVDKAESRTVERLPRTIPGRAKRVKQTERVKHVTGTPGLPGAYPPERRTATQLDRPVVMDVTPADLSPEPLPVTGTVTKADAPETMEHEKDLTPPKRVTTVPARTAEPVVELPVVRHSRLHEERERERTQEREIAMKLSMSERMLAGRRRNIKLTMSDILEAFEEQTDTNTPAGTPTGEE